MGKGRGGAAREIITGFYLLVNDPVDGGSTIHKRLLVEFVCLNERRVDQGKSALEAARCKGGRVHLPHPR